MFRFIVFAVLLAVISAAPALPPIESSGSLETPAAPSSITTSSDERISSSSSTTLGSSTSPLARPAILSAKALSTISEIRTPASTTKLTQWVAPSLVSPIAAPILSPLQVSAYAYAVPALGSLELAAAPSTYSIEQHGYRIIY